MACCPILPLFLPSCLRHAAASRCRRRCRSHRVGRPGLRLVVLPGSCQRSVAVSLACEAMCGREEEAQPTWAANGSTGGKHNTNTALPGRHSNNCSVGCTSARKLDSRPTSPVAT